MNPTKSERRVLARRAVVMLLCCLFFPTARATDERLAIGAEINHKPVRFAFDTGSTFSALWRQTVTNLGLSISNAPADHTMDSNSFPYAITEECRIDLGGITTTGSFAVLDVPDGVHLEIGGVLGWPALKENIVRFDFAASSFELLEKLPRLNSKWIKFELSTNSDDLVLEVPRKHGEFTSITIDTGNPGGISLNPEEWNKWIESHPLRPRTVESYFMPGAGILAQEVTWAAEISFENLVLHDVPLRAANTSEIAMTPGKFRASLGLAALKQFDVIVDGKHNVAYVQPKKLRLTPFQHNRSGVAFLPAESEKGNDLIARVIEGTPAYEAGIRNGDVLLKINGKDVSNWRAETADSDYSEEPAGTKLHLTLRSEHKEYEAIVVLRDLIGPSFSSRTTPQ